MKDEDYYRRFYISAMYDRIAFAEEKVKTYSMTPIESIAYYQLLLLQDSFGYNHFYVLPQMEVENYRIDFAIIFQLPGQEKIRLAIECDGHDFHEKTKQQASKDKRKDRQLQKYGYKILRYSGSDIVNNPRLIANDVIDLLPADEWNKGKKEIKGE